MAIEIKPLSKALGAEILRWDPSQPEDEADLAAIKAAFLQHHLLCIRTDPLEPSVFARVARHFGEPQLQLLRDQRDGAVPEVSFLESTYKTPEDKPDDLTRVRLYGWHTDDSYFALPAKATLLQG